MAPKKKAGFALLPKVSDLTVLSDDGIRAVLDTVSRVNERETRHATIRMGIAGFCFAVCVASFTYLVMGGHDKAAGLVLGTTVMGVVIQMINART